MNKFERMETNCPQCRKICHPTKEDCEKCIPLSESDRESARRAGL